MMGYMPETQEVTAVPPWPFFVRPILEALESGQPKTRQEIFSYVKSTCSFSQEALEATVSSGQTVIANRPGWATSNLIKASWISRPSKGIYQIADDGKKWLETNRTTDMTYSEANKIFKKYWPQRANKPVTLTPEQTQLSHDIETPVESIENSISVLTEATKDELLSRLRASDPTFFEKAVIKLLLAMGYGGAEQRGRQIGGTGDGGVDGVIDQDALGLEKSMFKQSATLRRQALIALQSASLSVRSPSKMLPPVSSSPPALSLSQPEIRLPHLPTASL